MTEHDSGVDLTSALQEVTVPAYVIDRTGRVRWLNRAAIETLGDVVGRSWESVVAPDDLQVARAKLAQKLVGSARATEFDLTLLRPDGRRLPVRVSSVPLRESGEITGIFGIAHPQERDDGAAPPRRPDVPELTARQYETLVLLADGLGTAAIAARLGVAEETARNHIRSVFGQLGVHSRLEAVVRAYRLGLLEPRREE
jgi:PAS domain S-box-containing protein